MIAKWLPAVLALACAPTLLAGQLVPPGRELPAVCAAGACLGGATWSQAMPSISGTRMTVDQQRAREIFNWKTFDIAAGYSVHFDQHQGSGSVALNQVLGNQYPQSIINGSLTAPGQVYVINQNGILFGDGARVNVHSLVASTQRLNYDFLEEGLTSAIQREDDVGRPINAFAFVGPDSDEKPMGEVAVAAGARITAKGDEKGGGRVLLIGPNVTNAGRIETPDGQAILVASKDKVYVAASNDPDLRGLLVEVGGQGGTVENTGTILAERGNVTLAGLAVNQKGIVRATTSVDFNGSIRLAARHQASDTQTVVEVHGQKTLDPVGTSVEGGGVVFGPGSLTEVLPELDDPNTAVDAQPQKRSRIEVDGERIHLQRGARLAAPGGEVVLGLNPDERVTKPVVPGRTDLVRLDAGAVIDVSGTDSLVLPMSANQGEIEFHGNELADFPLQRNGVLRGATIQFDLRNPPLIGNVQAVYDNIGRTVAERTSVGGSVTVTADAFEMAPGALVDISGGAVQYEPGVILSTLMVSDGRVFDISEAGPNRVYDAIAGVTTREHPKWGPETTETWNIFGGSSPFAMGRYEDGYIEGKDAGALVLNVKDLHLDGELRAKTIAGRLQRHPGSAVGNLDEAFWSRRFDQVPLGGLLAIGWWDGEQSVFGPNGLVIGEDTDDEDSEGTLVIDESLLEQTGINRARFVVGGGIRIDKGVELDLDPGADIDFLALGKIELEGSIKSPGARVSLETVGRSLDSDEPMNQSFSITLGADARIDTQGRWVNDNPLINAPGAAGTAPLFIHGGQVTLQAQGDLTLEAGSLIDVGGGAWLPADAPEVRAGRPGSISLSSTPAVGPTSQNSPDIFTTLRLDGELRGYGLDQGGELTLTGPAFSIRSGATGRPGPEGTPLDPGFFESGGFETFTLNASATRLTEDGTGILVGEDTRVQVRSKNLALTQPTDDAVFAGASLLNAPTGTDIDDLAEVRLLPEPQRRPTTLRLNANADPELHRTRDPAAVGVEVARGASLAAEAEGSIEIGADDRILVRGSLSAPAGTIQLTLEDAGKEVGFRNQGIWLDDTARLSAAGVAQVYRDDLGRLQGSVLPGGVVDVRAVRGYVVTAPGSIIDVSGAAGSLYAPVQTYFGPTGFAEVPAPSAAGRVNLVASEGVLPYGRLLGRAGGPGVAGGELTIALDPSNRTSNQSLGVIAYDLLFPVSRRTIQVGEVPAFDPTWLDFGGPAFEAEGAFKMTAYDRAGDDQGGLNGLAVVQPAALAGSGFDALRLSAHQQRDEHPYTHVEAAEIPAEVRFAGDVQLRLDRRLVIDAPVLSSTGGTVMLSAPYVAIGSTNWAFRATDNEDARVDDRVPFDLEANLFAPRTGTGRLRVQADLVDLVGFTSLQGFGAGDGPGADPDSPVIFAAKGDVRLRGIPVPPSGGSGQNFYVLGGALAAASDVTFEAAQVYPSSLSEFILSSEPEGSGTGTIRFVGNGAAAPVPLSAGALLTLSASNVEQQGVVRVPLGGLRVGRFERGPDGALVRNPVSGRPVLGSADRVTLADGSLTSVSGYDILVPLGELQFGTDWILPVNGGQRVMDEVKLLSNRDLGLPAEVTDRERPLTKRVELLGEAIAIKPGALIDVGGGGDIVAKEFQSGPLGSQDLLAAGAIPGAFAVLPTSGAEYAPYDPFLLPDFLALDDCGGVQCAMGTSFVVPAGGGVLPAGEYAALPPSYALLPGAFLVVPEPGTDYLPADFLTTRADGVPVIAGRMATAGTEIASPVMSGFAVLNGDQVRNRTEYLEVKGDEFFARRAARDDRVIPELPKDAGSVILSVTGSLELGGTLAPNLGGGAGPRVDVTADELLIGAELASGLNALGAESLLLGGVRTLADEALLIDARATSVEIEPGVTLEGIETILAATSESGGPGTVTLGEGASVRSTGVGDAAPVDIRVEGGGALLLVSGNEQGAFQRTESTDADTGDAKPGELTLEAGAVVAASGSIILDSSKDTTVVGSAGATRPPIQMDGGKLTLSSSRISLGGVGVGGLSLTAEQLNSLTPDVLVLTSRSSLDLYGRIDLAADSLILQTGALTAAGSGNLVTLSAGQFLLTNPGGAAAGAPPVGSPHGGELKIDADRITLGEGDYLVRGFDGLTLAADAEIIGSGTASLTVADATGVDIAAGRLTGAAGSDLRLLAPDAEISIRSTGNGRLDTLDTLGAKLTLEGHSIDYGGWIDMPAGQVALTTEGELWLHTGARIDVSGPAQHFADSSVGVPGGSVTLSSLSGNITMNGGEIDVSGTGEGGRVTVAAPEGFVSLFGELFGAGGADELGGSFTLDAQELRSPGYAFVALNRVLNDRGFSGERDLRLRTGSVVLPAGESIVAHEVHLTADAGSMDVAGTIDASGPEAGRVILDSRDAMRVSGLILANAGRQGEQGGEVLLSSREGEIDLGGAEIDVHGLTDPALGEDLTDTGLVRLTASRERVLAGDVKGIDPDAITGAERIEIVGNQIYGQDEVDSGVQDMVRDEAEAFMSGASADTFPVSDRIHLMPGVEIQSSGNLSLSDPWDLSTWRFAWRGEEEPGVLTMRAAGNLALAEDLSDGVVKRPSLDVEKIEPFFGFRPCSTCPAEVDALLTGQSWVYRLVAGADLGSADPLAVRSGADAEVRLEDGVVVRTGTGDIDIRAGGSLRYGGKNAAIYTIGKDAGYGTIELANFDLYKSFGLESLEENDPFFFDDWIPGAVFGTGGGDVRISVTEDVVGPGSDQLLTDWLVVLGGSFSINFDKVPTLWAVRPAEFRQNLGTLGGGDIRITAGGDIEDLSAVTATTGQPAGEGFRFDLLSLNFPGVENQSTRDRAPKVLGGGDLGIRAGGDVRGGTYFVGRGEGNIQAGGRVTAPEGADLNPVFALGDASLAVTAGAGLDVETVFNFSMLGRPLLPALGANSRAFYFTYGEDSAVRLTSLGGDVRLRNATSTNDPIFVENPLLPRAGQSPIALSLYPASVEVQALSGDIVLERDLRLFPAAQGTLELLAAGSIRDAGLESLNRRIVIYQLDVDPSLLPAPGEPVNTTPAGLGGEAFSSLLTPKKKTPTRIDEFLWHADVPVHRDDARPNHIVARGGTVGKLESADQGLGLFAAKRTLISAGRDVRNLDLEIQHAGFADDWSLVEAGRDILFELTRKLNTTGEPNQVGDESFLVSGPGRLTVVAGRDIDLGISDGIVSVGNLRNFALADGADLTVMAGVGEGLSYAAFFAAYVGDLPAADGEAIDYVRDLLGKNEDSLPRAEALRLVQTLRRYRADVMALGVDPDGPVPPIVPGDPLSEALTRAFFNELRESGLQATSGEPGFQDDYSRGFVATDTFFASSAEAPGDLRLTLSRIHTEDGGDIRVLVPGGGVDAGLTSLQGFTKKDSSGKPLTGDEVLSRLGIVTQRTGDIEAFVRDDFLVNASRVFALDGGILIWSAEGSIDAGRGAKTALSAPAPQPVPCGENGESTCIEFPAVIQGSGIRNFSLPGKEPKSVLLFAPEGVVSAGDAGIGSAGDVVIGAVEVLGADNIDIGGTAVGFSAGPPPSIAVGLTGATSVAASTSKLADQVTDQAVAENSSALSGQNLAVLNVEVIGFGN